MEKVKFNLDLIGVTLEAVEKEDAQQLDEYLSVQNAIVGIEFNNDLKVRKLLCCSKYRTLKKTIQISCRIRTLFHIP